MAVGGDGLYDVAHLVKLARLPGRVAHDVGRCELVWRLFEELVRAVSHEFVYLLDRALYIVCTLLDRPPKVARVGLRGVGAVLCADDLLFMQVDATARNTQSKRELARVARLRSPNAQVVP